MFLACINLAGELRMHEWAPNVWFHLGCGLEIKARVCCSGLLSQRSKRWVKTWDGSSMTKRQGPHCLHLGTAFPVHQRLSLFPSWLALFQRSEAGKQPSILWRVIYISVQSFLLRARGQNLPNSISVKHLPQLWAFSFSPLRDWALLPLPVLLPKWPRGHGLDNPIVFTPKASQSGASQTHLHTCSPCCLGLTNDTGLVVACSILRKTALWPPRTSGRQGSSLFALGELSGLSSESQ